MKNIYRNKELQYVLFAILSITINHIFLNLYTGIFAFIVCTYVIFINPVFLFIVVVYGYLTQTIISQDTTRIYYSGSFFIGIMAYIFNSKKYKDIACFCINKKIVVILFLIVTIILLSEIYDPLTRIAGSGPFFRVYDICIAFILATTIRSVDDIRYALSAFSASSLYIAVYFLNFINTKGSDSIRSALISGDISVDTNYMAFYLCLGFSPILAFVINSDKIKLIYKISAILASILVFVAILFTSSRMGIIIAFVNILSLSFIIRRRIYIIWTIFFISLTIYFFIYPEIFLNIKIITEILNRFTDSTLLTGSGRIDLWAMAFHSISVSNITQMFIGSGSQANYTLLSGANAHNAFLEYIIDHGFIGLILLVSCLVVAWKNIKNIDDSLTSAVLQCVWLTLILSSLSLSPFVRTWAWIAIAPMLVIPCINNKTR